MNETDRRKRKEQSEKNFVFVLRCYKLVGGKCSSAQRLQNP